MTRRLGRRAALALPLATAGCSLFDDWFGENKPRLPGDRIPILALRRGAEVDNPDARPVALPKPAPNGAWPQNGGDPSHAMGHLASADVLGEAWSARIGKGGGYRRKITAHPVIADGRVLTMDSDAVVRAFDARSGSNLWEAETQDEDSRSGNVGGGIALDGGRLFVATGRGDALAMLPADGKIVWRQKLGTAARAAPTVADGRMFVPTIDDQLAALATEDGRRLWAYQANSVDTSILGLPSPAYADGIVVAGFGSGDLVGVRATSGSVVWSDSLASGGGRTSLIDLPTVRGLPVVDNGQVFAIGVGGLMISLDLRTGRRLWERDIGSTETPWLAGEWLFVLTTEQELLAINREDGAIAWVTPLPRFENEEKQRDPIRWLGPTLVGDRLVLPGSVDRAVAVSPYTGKVLGRQELSASASVSPVVADGTVYLVTDDARLLALR